MRTETSSRRHVSVWMAGPMHVTRSPSSSGFAHARGIFSHQVYAPHGSKHPACGRACAASDMLDTCAADGVLGKLQLVCDSQSGLWIGKICTDE
jgi:hypothetical protein